MPLYSYECEKCKKTFEKLAKYEDFEVSCECSGKAPRKNSYKFNATNLPNGFANTRSKSRKEEK